MRTYIIGLSLALFCFLITSPDAAAQGVRKKQASRASANAFSDLGKFVAPVRPDDAQAATWRLAELMSFMYVTSTGKTPLPPPERLYLPYRSLRLTTNPVTGYDRAARVLLDQFDRLTKAQDVDVARAARRARSLYLERYKIGAFNQVFGNTPDSSFTDFARYMNGGMQKLDEFEREMDRDKAEGGEGAPMSAASFRKLVDFARAMESGRLKSIVGEGARRSGWLAYGDMAAVDRQAAYWQAVLLPLLKKSAGPDADRELVKIDAAWRPKGGRDAPAAC